MRALRKRGDKTGVLSIGPAGEMRMASANISVSDPEGKIRSHGRGGLGAVMGSKKIKYISIDDTDCAGVRSPTEKFKGRPGIRQSSWTIRSAARG